MGLRSILYLALCLQLISLIGQSKDFQEEVHVSVNSTNVLVGETLNFSGFVYSNTSKKLSPLSSVLYLELIDESGKAIHQTKIGLRNGCGSGSIYINPDWATGTYRLISYTKWMMNYDAFHEQHLLIFNPYNGVKKNESINGNPLKIEEQQLTELDTYSPLQSVSLSLGIIETSTLSIAIHKVSDVYYDNQVTLEHQKVSMSSYEILPDYRYAQVQGRVHGSNRLDKLRVMMTIKGTAMQVATTQTDHYGRFWMSYNPDLLTNEAVAQVQVEGDGIEDINIIEEFYPSHASLNESVTSLDSLTSSNLITRSINNQIQQAYKEPVTLDADLRAIYTQADAKVYYLDDYERFPSIRDTFIEYIYYVGVSKSENNYKLNVLCPEPPELNASNKEPLILLDGLAISAEDIFKQSPNDIEKIEVIPNYYFINDVVYKGVISVHSFGRKELEVTSTSKRFTLANYQPYKPHVDSLTLKDHLPMYQPSLFWEPIRKHSHGELILEFSTSRLEGTYQISVRGITVFGKPVNLVKYIRVCSSN